MVGIENSQNGHSAGLSQTKQLQRDVIVSLTTTLRSSCACLIPTFRVGLTKAIVLVQHSHKNTACEITWKRVLPKQNLIAG